MSRFDAEVLLALRGARTVRIETSARAGGPTHSATIWVVVDEMGRVLVRSWRGERGRWYRELRANPSGTLHVANRHVPIRADLADDAQRIEACSRALREKYASARGSLAEMLVHEVLPTTLELRPA
ncbi:MAG: nitroreductase/quinone reductase family protein [Candidatus Limnocylindria bacterium]